MKAPSIFRKQSPYSFLIKRGLILVVLIAIQPFLWNYVSVLTTRLQEKRTEAEQLSNLQRRLTEINGQLQAQQPYVDQLTSSFPLLGSESQLIERVEQLGHSMGLNVHIKSIAKQGVAEQVDKGKVLTSLVITLETQGAPSSLLKYIDALEHVQELSVLQNVGISQQALTGGFVPGAGYNMTMNVVFYLQQPPHG